MIGWKKEKKITLAYNKIFTSHEGKVVLEDLAEISKFNGDVSCEMEEGARRLFLYILKKSRLKNLRKIESMIDKEETGEYNEI